MRKRIDQPPIVTSVRCWSGAQEGRVRAHALVSAHHHQIGKGLPEDERTGEVNGIQSPHGFAREGLFCPPGYVIGDFEDGPGRGGLSEDSEDVGALGRRETPLALGAAHDTPGFDERQAGRDHLAGRSENRADRFAAAVRSSPIDQAARAPGARAQTQDPAVGGEGAIPA